MDQFLNFGVQSLFVGGTAPYTASYETIAASSIQGVQSASLSMVWPRQEALDWNGGEHVNVQRPQAQLDFSYIFSSEYNDEKLGMAYNFTGYSTPALSNLDSERNYYLLANMDGEDMMDHHGQNESLIALGNGLLTSYSFSAAVGQPSTVSAGVEGLNLLIYTGTSGFLLPSVYKQFGTGPTGQCSLPTPVQIINDYYVANPAAITLSFGTGSALGLSMSGNNQVPLDSFSFNIEIPRAQTKDLGWVHPQYRAVQYPITLNIQADGTVNQLQADNISRFVCNDSGIDISIGFRTDCNTTDNFYYEFLGAKLERQSFSSSIGPLSRVSLNWSLKIFDIEKTRPNFYINSTGTPYSSIIWDQVDYTAGYSPLTLNLSTPCFLSVLSGPAILNANYVVLVGDPAQTVIRCVAADGSGTEDVTATVS
jgi:hypothetical protein